MENSKRFSTQIDCWFVNDRPRDKLFTNGFTALSNSELLSLLINGGSKEKTSLDLAKSVLELAGGNLNELGKLSLYDFQKINGIGEAKSSLIAAALELGRRRELSVPMEKAFISSSSDIAHYLKVSLKDYNYEVFAVIFLNRSNRIQHFEIISKGGITGTVADPKLILKKAVEKEATSLILAHNHPSGSLIPSNADKSLTVKIKHAASYFDISVLDHIIVSEDGYYSFADAGVM